ncbi:GPI inositol deacylase [Ascosphaera atra]|nr:GPI inositol deacylase [Ascosphaera atra]
MLPVRDVKQTTVALTLLFTSFSAPSRSVLANSSPAGWLGNSTGVAAGQVDYGKNDILLGSPDSFFWFLVPLFGVISVGACFVTNLLVLGVTEVLCLGWSFWVDRGGYIKHEEPRPDTPTTTSASRNRIINAVVLLLLVATLIPYQFAYAVVCIVQLATCVRALHQFRETVSPIPSPDIPIHLLSNPLSQRLTPHYNFYNYAHSILVLMLWILPINAVVLLVWVRYVSVHWLMPFTSHHNILSVLPYMLLVEAQRNGSMVPRITTRYQCM